MKSFILSLMLLSLTSSAFASASWKLTCVGDSGVSFYNDNGQAEITFTSTSKEGQLNRTSMSVAIENYDLGLEQGQVLVKWVGKQKIIADQYENSCGRDRALTSFSQKVQIIRLDNKSSKTISVICSEETLTGVGTEVDECLN